MSQLKRDKVGEGGRREKENKESEQGEESRKLWRDTY